MQRMFPISKRPGQVNFLDLLFSIVVVNAIGNIYLKTFWVNSELEFFLLHSFILFSRSNSMK